MLVVPLNQNYGHNIHMQGQATSPAIVDPRPHHAANQVRTHCLFDAVELSVVSGRTIVSNTTHEDIQGILYH